MTDFLRWQWMWRSRPRLLLIAVGAVVFGGLLILFALTRTRPLRKGEMLLIYGGITFVVMGLYQLLQGLFSPAGAFGVRASTRWTMLSAASWSPQVM